MRLSIRSALDYEFEQPTDILLQIEAALIPEQRVERAWIDIPPGEHFARVAAEDEIGERIWLRTSGRLSVRYEATVAIERILADPATLPIVPHHQLPGETVPYLFASRYCQSDRFESFVRSEFGGLEGGPLVAALRDWIHGSLSYVPGSSDATTTAADTFVRREGVCRDYAHLMITLTRAAGIPARIASVYAIGVDPPDFHAVAEVFLGGAWHLIDPTGMATEGGMAKIGVGRDVADVSFLTAFGNARMIEQSVEVRSA